MEPTSLRNDEAAREMLEAQLRECFGRVVYSHKTHEKCADILLWRLSVLKHTQIILSVLTSGSLLTEMLGTHTSKGVVPTVFSALLLFLNLYFKNYNYGQMAQSHKEAADKLWNVRESYLSLLTDLNSGGVTPAQAADRRDKLQKELSTIYSHAPRTNSSAYKNAQDALQYREDMTFSVEEIDAFLPSPLKRGRSNDGGRNP